MNVNIPREGRNGEGKLENLAKFERNMVNTYPLRTRTCPCVRTCLLPKIFLISFWSKSGEIREKVINICLKKCQKITIFGTIPLGPLGNILTLAWDNRDLGSGLGISEIPTSHPFLSRSSFLFPRLVLIHPPPAGGYTIPTLHPHIKTKKEKYCKLN